MNILTLTVLMSFLFSFTTLAEHDATYCGTIEHDPSGAALVILNVTYLQHTGDLWEDSYVDVSSPALIFDVKNVEKLMWFLEHSKEETIFCAKGRWGGAYYSHNLRSDNIDRFDYASRFEENE